MVSKNGRAIGRTDTLGLHQIFVGHREPEEWSLLGSGGRTCSKGLIAGVGGSHGLLR